MLRMDMFGASVLVAAMVLVMAQFTVVGCAVKLPQAVTALSVN